MMQMEAMLTCLLAVILLPLCFVHEEMNVKNVQANVLMRSVCIYYSLTILGTYFFPDPQSANKKEKKD
jgi:lysylphosphatidylglycerol synthetase-like protein (DUF2156 family)